ncbi:MAG: protein kinase [Gemmataceae bacterium]|nr:protein kinase [Gemmataceae bacterium]
MKSLSFEPIHERVEVPTGTSLLQTLLSKQFQVLMACGGKGLCATCHVRVRDGMDKLTNRTERERMTLSFISGTDHQSRLACQCRVLGDGVVVELPEGMYIERAEDLLSLLGTRAPSDILHPIKGSVLIAKGKIITRTQIEALKGLNVEMNRVRGDGAPLAALTPPAETPAAPLPPFAAPPAPRATDPGTRAADTVHSSTSSTQIPEDAPHVDKSPSKRFELGRVLGKCLLVERIGQGATGVVYRALHRTLNIPVAVKVLQFDDSAQDRSLFDRFQTEARLLAQLNHPNIVRVWDFEEDPHAPYLVLEYVEGLSLAELIQQSGRLCQDRAIALVTQIAEALAAAWKVGVVHRDVKPGNILLARDGTAKLADLGLALVVEQRLSADRKEEGNGERLAGTVAYMAPEQAATGRVDHRSDIYALGATFYHAVTGRLPFGGRTRMEVILKHSREPLQPAHEACGDLDPTASAIIARMMAKAAEDRYQTCEELLADLRSLQQKTPAAPSAKGAETLSSSGDGRAARKSLLSIFGWRRGQGAT